MNANSRFNKISIRALLLIYAVVALFTTWYFNGTAGSGDSVLHYLYARYAPLHPGLYFHHWAKPVFVLLASPFAQFGFTGMKVFNALAVLLTIWFTYKTSVALNFKNTVVVALLLFFTPLYYVLTFSGLTEPLFALFVAIGLYFAVAGRFLPSCLAISFLPLVRSEGIIILGVFGLFFLLKKQWKYLPALLAGQFVYSLAGWPVHQDALWVFSKIPYASLSTPYGKGELTHFIVQLYYVIGLPIYILFWIGLLRSLLLLVKGKIKLELHVLVVLGTICYVLAHTLFWYMGIFNSMGLKRVLIGIMPFIAIIALMGFNFLTGTLAGVSLWARRSATVLILVSVVVFPFTANPAAVKWEREMQLTAKQHQVNRIVDYLTTRYNPVPRIVCADPYVSLALEIDHFDDRQRIQLSHANLEEKIKPGDIVIWDDWLAAREMAVARPHLSDRSSLSPVDFPLKGNNAAITNYAVFRVN